MELRVSPIGQIRTTSRAVIESIFRYKRRFIATLVVALCSVALYTFFSPRRYQSEMDILVRSAQPDYPTTHERTNGFSAQRDVTEEHINSEIRVLRSQDLADRVVDPDWNASSPRGRTSIELRNHERAVKNFTQHLYIEPIRKSNVIHVVYEAGSAIGATDTVEKLLQAFLAKEQQFERSSDTSSFFATEQQHYKRELDTAQQQLASYQQDRQIVSLPDKEVALEHQIVELQQQLRSTDVLISELSDRLVTGQKELQSLAQRQITQQKTVPNILAIEQLTTMLATYRNQKTSLLTKFPPTDRMVQEVDQQIVNTVEALRAASETQASEKSTDVNPVWQQVKAAMSQNTIDRSAAEVRRRDLRVQIAGLMETLKRTEGATVGFNTLQAKVTELQVNYHLYTQKLNEAQVASAIGMQQSVNVDIAERPTFSPTPSSPNLGLTLIMGALASAFFALGAVFVSEMTRETIASASELEKITTIPILATLPLLKADYLRFNEDAQTAEIYTQAVATGQKHDHVEAKSALAVTHYPRLNGQRFSKTASIDSRIQTQPMMILLP